MKKQTAKPAKPEKSEAAAPGAPVGQSEPLTRPETPEQARAAGSHEQAAPVTQVEPEPPELPVTLPAAPGLSFSARIRTDGAEVKGKVLALADVVIAGEIIIRDFRVIDGGGKGIFVGNPGRWKPKANFRYSGREKPGKDDYVFRDHAYALTKEARERLHSAILDAFSEYQEERRASYFPDYGEDDGLFF